MRIVPIDFCIAKMQPKYWFAIAKKQKTIEIRDERVDADCFIFQRAVGYPLLGEAIITGEQVLNVGTTTLPDGAGTTMSELEHIYPHAIKNGVLVKPLYAYSIQPAALGDIAFDVLEKIM